MVPTGRLLTGAFLFAFGSICYALLGILSQLSKSPDGSYAYSLPSVVLIAEFVKLCLSFLLLSVEQGSPVDALKALFSGSWMSWLAFAVPSALYSLNNNLDMLNNQHMDPATEQVLVQAKILTTGVVWWLVFREPLGLRKWSALLLLFFGTVLAGWPSREKQGDVKQMFISPFGVVLVSLYVWISASAGVYNEWLYKGIGAKDSLHVCNIKLYTIGCIFNFSAHHMSSGGFEALSGLLKGYNFYVWCLVATYSLMGLLLAQVMKHFNNIVKLFMSGSSMYVSAVLSWAIFGYQPSWTFLGGLVIVSAAMLLYNLERIVRPKAQ